MFKSIIINYFRSPALWFLGHILLATSECNVCSFVNNLACVSQTQFQVCINGLPEGTVTSCPTGFVCSTNTPKICQPNQMGFSASCSNCNQCDASNTFACTGMRTFALCLGNTFPSDITGSCAPFHVCNINYPQICGNATIGISATCPTANAATETSTAIPTPTPTPPSTSSLPPPVLPTMMPPNFITNYVRFFCQSVRSNTRFPLPQEIDNTCRRQEMILKSFPPWMESLRQLQKF
uniref:Chitin-binding type-2 domain-containing protein n=1 Tax=Glossina brevipalpis TaxID=37001 RepID=A0A1A9W3G4_9MUSC